MTACSPVAPPACWNMREGKVTRLHAWLAERGEALVGFASTAYSDSINDLLRCWRQWSCRWSHADERLVAIAASRGWRSMPGRGATPAH